MTDSFSLSKSSVPRLEITHRSLCGRMCDYCPQEAYRDAITLSNIKQRDLTTDLVKLILPNIPSNTIISHTGFTEPLENKYFGPIAQDFHDHEYNQLISTTLVGHSSSKQFFLENFHIFNHGITLHLPDGQGYMKGVFNEAYSGYLADLLHRIYKYNSTHEAIPITLFLIGDCLHSSIVDVVNRFTSLFPPNTFQSAKYLNTRAGNINPQDFDKKQSSHGAQNSSQNNQFYCGYRRLNRGVLLPNGDVTLCCQDYSLKCILGSLLHTSLDTIYNTIQDDPQLSSLFVSGNLSPCKDCEHYVPLTTNFTGSRT